jgi:hypothetical protein
VIRWQSFHYAGKEYHLAHLHPTTITYEQSAKGNKPACTYTVNVTFGLHCFTCGITPQCDPALLYSDAREAREFDFQRYELSKRLPEIVGDLSCRKCFHTEHGNFFTIDLVDEQGEVLSYEVYFAASGSQNGCVNLFVQSAYVRHKSSRHHKKPISFFVILFNTLHKRPIKVPP